MKILYKLTTLALLLIVTITAEAQTTPPAGTPVITLTVTNNATITFRMAAAANNTPAWVETTPGTYTTINIGTGSIYNTYTATGTIIKVYGAITFFNCEWNKEKLTALDVSTNTALTGLECDGNQLTALDVSKNTALTGLYCSYNQLTTLDVSTNTALTTLYYSYNQLTTLDVCTNTALTDLGCGSNKLTSLDVSKNTALTTLWCHSNQLTALDVSKNTALTNLLCYSNQLTALDVSKNTALAYLNCGSNQLTALDVSTNTALTYLLCDGNKLTALDVSKNTELTKIYCYANPLNTAAIDALYCSLPFRAAADNAIIRPAYNSTDANNAFVLASNTSNATAKGWVVNYDDNSIIPTTGIYTCGSPIVLATEIILNKVTATVETGKTITLTATVKPDNSTYKGVVWSSANTAIATVNNNGLVTGGSAGTATITAKTEDGGYEANCVVTVTSTTGVETETATTLGLYPNPAMAEVFIKGVEIPTLVEVYSTTGQLMLAQTLAPAQPINISHLQPGVYMVKVNGIAMKLMVAGR